MKKMLIWLVLIVSIIQCRFLDIELDEKEFDNRLVKQKIDTCIQKQCIYKDEELMSVCKGFDECVNISCRSELKLDNYAGYVKCNQNCLSPFIQGITDSDKELITGFYSCRLQCVQQEIKEKQLNNQSEEEQSSNDEMKIQAIFVSISIFVALAIGIALYIWCSIYHRRRQELIIVPGQINSNDQQNAQSQQVPNQEILQSRITDPDKIFVVEGSAILHNNQKIIPKFGFNIPQGIIVGTQLNQEQKDQSKIVSQSIADATLIDMNQTSTYNNISVLEFGNDISNNLINNQNSNGINQVNGQNLNSLDRSISVVNQSIELTNQHSQNQQNNNIGNIRNYQNQVNNQQANQQNLNGDRSPYLIADRSPYLVGDRSPYITTQNKVIPIHDIFISSAKNGTDKKDNQQETNLQQVISNPTLNTESNNPNTQILLQLLNEQSPSQMDNKKSKNLLGADLMKKSSKQSSKRPSKRNSILANLENRASANKQKSSHFTVFFPNSDNQGKSESDEESEYEYYYETGSSDSSNSEDNQQSNKDQINNKRKSAQLYKTEEIGKSQICLDFPGCQDDLHQSEEEKVNSKKEGANLSNGENNKFNGSTDDTIIASSTSQNFGQQSGFTLRCYSAEKQRENHNITDRFNESQKIMINKGNYTPNINNGAENTSNEKESPAHYLNQSQILTPDIYYQNKQSPQKLLLKACDEEITVMQPDVRKKSSSIDISGSTQNQQPQQPANTIDLNEQN